MLPPTRYQVLFMLAGLAILLDVTGARAGIVPLANQSFAYARASVGTIVSSDLQAASGTGIWNGLALAEADNEAGTIAACDALLDCEMASDCLFADGRGRGIGGGPAPFQHQTEALLSMLFIVNETQDYVASVEITPGTLPAAPGHVSVSL
jgi:hypothetical protein